jgi:muramoyltetrapeptide carboxypeptidase
MLIKRKIVDVIFPSTSPTKVDAIEEYLVKIGFEGRFFLKTKKNNEEKLPFYSVNERFNDLKNAIENNESQIIWCGRGGFGSGDLLPFLPNINFPKNQKTIIGFSDATSIFTYLQHNVGYKIIYAPDLTLLSQEKISILAQQELINLISKDYQKLEFELVNITKHHQEIRGKLTGGCLSVFVSQFGGISNIDLKNKILFLEDEGETGERLDRYFRQILEFIIKNQQKPKAILLGNFLQQTSLCTPSQKSIEQAISKLLEKNLIYKLNIPIFIEKNKKLGHGKNMHPLILGEEGIISDKDGRLTLSQTFTNFGHIGATQ